MVPALQEPVQPAGDDLRIGLNSNSRKPFLQEVTITYNRKARMSYLSAVQVPREELEPVTCHKQVMVLGTNNVIPHMMSVR